MTLPSSGALTHTSIQTEFGGTNPITMSEYYGRTANIAASGAIKMSMFYGQSALGATLPATLAVYAFNISPMDADAAVEFYTTGGWALLNNGSVENSGTWKVGGTSSDFDIRFTKSTGTTPSGPTVNTWHRITSNIGWYITETTDGYATKDCTGTVEIRMNASPQTVFDSAAVTLQAVVEV